jgi:prolyl-tRNA synthetase
MKMSHLVGKRIKETPKDAQTDSHVFLVRGGYIRPVSAGIYSLLPIAKRIVQKIENLIREEMNRIEGQEVLMPVVLPRELWEESGRYGSVGAELLRFKDRNGKDMLLGMTHEEAVVHLARSEVNSYKQLPFMLYQIQTKYRDEARPRAGLIRVREFTMKDAYSFHSSDECLKEYYQRAHEAYERVFRRLGMKNVVSIESDTGMMGGAVSHEFMAVADCGEDTLFICQCGYKANKEVARTGLKFQKEQMASLTKVHTPGQKTIEEVSRFLKVAPAQTGKAVFYTDDDGRLTFVVIRGDLEVNETKLRNHLRIKELKFANDEQIRAIGSVPGFASPLNIDPSKVRIIFDRSAVESNNLVVGANDADYHNTGFNFERDMAAVKSRIEIMDISAARDGDPCPHCNAPLKLARGIEVGNIFQLGTKYSESMNCTYLDQNGKSQPMIMGCYGIGVGRSMAAVIEQSHDQYGPIWPISIAPFQVHICALNLNEPGVRETAERLYSSLTGKGIEVLYDDRNEKAGSAFNDADLLGVPFRAIISPKNLAAQTVELKARDGSLNEKVPLAEVESKLLSLIEAARRASI